MSQKTNFLDILYKEYQKLENPISMTCSHSELKTNVCKILKMNEITYNNQLKKLINTCSIGINGDLIQIIRTDHMKYITKLIK